jgi:DNA-directed RNA polymerase specialized sigma24 family protein
MQSRTSISTWIADLKSGEARAAQQLWNYFSSRLTELAKRKLHGAPKGFVDEEDIAQSVFRTVCRGAAAGRLQDVHNQDELWWLMLAITKRKVVDHIRKESALKRGAGQYVASESSCEPITLDWLVGDEPTPDFIVMLDEQHGRLLGLLGDDRLRYIAVARIEGFSVPEIAAELSISQRSVERKLQLIRKEWAHDLLMAQ